MVWIKSKSELTLFINEINQKPHLIKFDFKFSKEGTDFLSTLLYVNSNNRIQTTLYQKPTDCQNYLRAKLKKRSQSKKVTHIVRHSELSAHVQPLKNI